MACQCIFHTCMIMYTLEVSQTRRGHCDTVVTRLCGGELLLMSSSAACGHSTCSTESKSFTQDDKEEDYREEGNGDDRNDH